MSTTNSDIEELGEDLPFTDESKINRDFKRQNLVSEASGTRDPAIELEKKQARERAAAKKRLDKKRKSGQLPSGPLTKSSKPEKKKSKPDSVVVGKRITNIAKKYNVPFLDVLKKIPGLSKGAKFASAVVDYAYDKKIPKTDFNYKMIARVADQQKISPVELKNLLNKKNVKRQVDTYLENKKKGKLALTKDEIETIEEELGRFPEKGYTPFGHKDIKEGPLALSVGKQKRLSQLEKELTGMSPGTFKEVVKGKTAKETSAALRKSKRTGEEGGYRLAGEKPQDVKLTKDAKTGKYREETAAEKKKRIAGMSVKEKRGYAIELEKADRKKGSRVSAQDVLFGKGEEFFDRAKGTSKPSAFRVGTAGQSERVLNQVKLKSLKSALSMLQKAKKEGKSYVIMDGKKVSVKAIPNVRDRIASQIKKVRKKEQEVPSTKTRLRPKTKAEKKEIKRKTTRVEKLTKEIKQGRAVDKTTSKKKPDKKYLTKEYRKNVPLKKTKIYLRKGENMLSKGGLVDAGHYFRKVKKK